MSLSWIKTALKYALLLAPTAVLLGLIGLVVLGVWVASILRDPGRFDEAPVLVQKFTRAAYWHTRTHWQTVPECAVFDRELLYRPRSGSCEFRNAEFATTMNFDDRGARATPPPLATPDRTPRPRLVILGDSHAMGWGVEDYETFASVLASEYGYPTANLGVSSYATPRELRRLERDFALLPDDVIVIQYSDNDVEENRYFAEHRRVGPYDAAELEAQFAYRPTQVATLPVAGLLLRLLWQDLIESLPGSGAGEDPSPKLTAAAAFLQVLDYHPQLRSHRIIVVAINSPGNRTDLSADELAAAGIALVVPVLTQDQFLAIDDHMRPSGHRNVAEAIAVMLSR